MFENGIYVNKNKPNQKKRKKNMREIQAINNAEKYDGT